ncbi:unnamed protein product, partial [Rotaria sordida]
SIIESNTIENHFKIEVKDDNNKEQCTDLLIEPIIAGNINKPVKSSPTIATHFLGVIYTLVSTSIFVSSTFITKELSIDMLYALIPMALLHSIMMIIHMKLIKRYSLYRQSIGK